MEDFGESQSVPAQTVGHGDLVQDPDTGRWLTVTRIVSGTVTVDGGGPPSGAADELAGPFWSFYGDERLDEVATFRGEEPAVPCRRAG